MAYTREVGVHLPFCWGRCLVGRVDGSDNLLPVTVVAIFLPLLLWIYETAFEYLTTSGGQVVIALVGLLTTSATICLFFTFFTEPGILPTKLLHSTELEEKETKNTELVTTTDVTIVMEPTGSTPTDNPNTQPQLDKAPTIGEPEPDPFVPTITTTTMSFEPSTTLSLDHPKPTAADRKHRPPPARGGPGRSGSRAGGTGSQPQRSSVTKTGGEHAGVKTKGTDRKIVNGRSEDSYTTSTRRRVYRIQIGGELFTLPQKRAKFCRETSNCVEKFDHFCPWVSNAIGIRNYRYFVGFVSSLFGLALMLTASSLYQTLIFAKPLYHLIVLAVLTTFAGICSISLGHLCMYSMYLITINQTTNENVKRTYHRRKNTYDLGWRRNWAWFLCGEQRDSYFATEAVFTGKIK